MNSGVVAYPGLEASHLFLQPTAGQPSAQRAADVSGDAAQPTPSPLSSSTPRPTLPAQVIQQWHPGPSAYWGPQHYYSYYDPTRHHQSPSTPLFFSMPGPHHPSVSPPSTALVTDAMAESLLASLRALQSQFTAFQESLGNVKSDVKDALSQLHALRAAQNKMAKRTTELESIISATSTGGRRGRGRGRGGTAGTHAESPPEGADAGTIPEKTLIQSLASIQSAVEVLLARESRASQSRDCLFSLCTNANQLSICLPDLTAIQQEATLQPPPPPSVNLTGQASRSFLDLAQQCSTLQSISATLSISQSESSSPLSSIAIPIPGTSPPPAAPGKGPCASVSCPIFCIRRYILLS